MEVKLEVGVYCHNIPNPPLYGGYRTVTKDMKKTDMTKMAKLYISTQPNPMVLGPQNTFSAQNQNTPNDFQLAKGGWGHFSNPPTPPPLKLGFRCVRGHDFRF